MTTGLVAEIPAKLIVPIMTDVMETASPVAADKRNQSLEINAFPAELHPLLSQIDESGDGHLDLEELTEMCTVYVEMKKASATGCIAIATLPKEIQPALQAFDVVRGQKPERDG